MNNNHLSGLRSRNESTESETGAEKHTPLVYVMDHTEQVLLTAASPLSPPQTCFLPEKSAFNNLFCLVKQIKRTGKLTKNQLQLKDGSKPGETQPQTHQDPHTACPQRPGEPGLNRQRRGRSQSGTGERHSGDQGRWREETRPD